MNRSKIDQRMNGNPDSHLYLYYGFKLRHQNDAIGYFVSFSKQIKISAQTRRLPSNAFQFNMIFRLDFFRFVATGNHSHPAYFDAFPWKMTDERCIFASF